MSYAPCCSRCLDAGRASPIARCHHDDHHDGAIQHDGFLGYSRVARCVQRRGGALTFFQCWHQVGAARRPRCRVCAQSWSHTPRALRVPRAFAHWLHCMQGQNSAACHFGSSWPSLVAFWASSSSSRFSRRAAATAAKRTAWPRPLCKAGTWPAPSVSAGRPSTARRGHCRGSPPPRTSSSARQVRSMVHTRKHDQIGSRGEPYAVYWCFAVVRARYPAR